MRCLVFALAMIFAGCSTHNQLGRGDSRGSSALPGPETTVIWLDNLGGFPSVGYFDVQTIFNETDLGHGSYVRIAALQVTGTSQKALLGVLRLRASQMGANRLLIVKAEAKKEEVYLYSGLENVARFFSGEKTDADRRDEAYTLRIDAIAIRLTDDRSTVYRPRLRDDRSTVYRPRLRDNRSTVYRPRLRDNWSTVYRPRRPDHRPTLKPPRRRDDRPTVRPPPPKDDRPTVRPPPPKDDQPTVRPPPPKDDRPTEKPSRPKDDPSTVKPPPTEDDRSTLKRPRLKTHRP